MMNEVIPYTPYSDVLYYTAKILKENFPKYNIYIDENEEEIPVPSFFIKITPLTQTYHFDWIQKLVNINISYVNKEWNQENRLNVIDAVTEAFRDRIIVGEKKPLRRALPVFQEDFEKTDDALIFTITLNYFDGRGRVDDLNREYDKLMEIIHLNIKGNTSSYGTEFETNSVWTKKDKETE